LFSSLISKRFFKFIWVGLIFIDPTSNVSAQKLPLYAGIQAKDNIQFVHYFATWCAPCMHELPVFDTLTNLYSSEKIDFIFVCMDLKNSKKLRKSLFKLNLPGPVYFLEPTENAIKSITTNWSGSIPATMIYFPNTTQNQFIEGRKNVLFYRNLIEK